MAAATAAMAAETVCGGGSGDGRDGGDGGDGRGGGAGDGGVAAAAAACGSTQGALQSARARAGIG